MSPAPTSATRCCRDESTKANGFAQSQPWKYWEWKKGGCKSMTAPRFIIGRTSTIPRRRFAMSETSSCLLRDRQLLPSWRDGLRLFLGYSIQHVLINLNRARLFHSGHHRREVISKH